MLCALLLGAALLGACRHEPTRLQDWTAADNAFLREFQALADGASEAPP